MDNPHPKKIQRIKDFFEKNEYYIAMVILVIVFLVFFISFFFVDGRGDSYTGP
ncbi:hypothetical protein ACTJJ0_05475 [Chitinophaga sp. 22321]|uniref:Uncharacterized protein n=1 Tax=Chitinophaga hostae TaxID=2831022 RepID=A0ABS5IZ92_9BACT|nr:hypothetical protein [Chitinophaga hostae]MBS0028293.1 hypothetical protein [Chitinophaga hostae]